MHMHRSQTRQVKVPLVMSIKIEANPHLYAFGSLDAILIVHEGADKTVHKCS